MGAWESKYVLALTYEELNGGARRDKYDGAIAVQRFEWTLASFILKKAGENLIAPEATMEYKFAHLHKPLASVLAATHTGLAVLTCAAVADVLRRNKDEITRLQEYLDERLAEHEVARFSGSVSAAVEQSFQILPDVRDCNLKKQRLQQLEIDTHSRLHEMRAFLDGQGKWKAVHAKLFEVWRIGCCLHLYLLCQEVEESVLCQDTMLSQLSRRRRELAPLHKKYMQFRRSMINQWWSGAYRSQTEEEKAQCTGHINFDYSRRPCDLVPCRVITVVDKFTGRRLGRKIDETGTPSHSPIVEEYLRYVAAHSSAMTAMRPPESS
eukprot:TRINITY_DN23187_c1_g2_i1.p1 TRINITY_DN23187_c1_g2~~TRINITY_DN23187_c1_g2_i1.p1  ORF type:complete len:323 (+),score=28.53 TRINITY_DN23187_c1_g2_i1:86-1054(+)